MFTYRNLKKYKYQLTENYSIKLKNIYPVIHITTAFIRMKPLRMIKTNSLLEISKYYAWDGPSGLTIDTENFMEGSLVHDVLYQLMREKHLNYKWRKRSDQILREICRKNGMGAFRAWYVYQSVRVFAGSCAK